MFHPSPFSLNSNLSSNVSTTPLTHACRKMQKMLKISFIHTSQSKRQEKRRTPPPSISYHPPTTQGQSIPQSSQSEPRNSNPSGQTSRQEKRRN